MTARRVVTIACLLALWGAGGVGTYSVLGSHRSVAARKAGRPDQATVNPALAGLPGTLYLVQGGALYRLQQGRFTTVLKAGGWAQPRVLPGGQSLVLVRRDPSGYSDLYRTNASGATVQLTRDQGRGAVQGTDPGSQLVTQYWAMYPQASPDGTRVLFLAPVGPSGYFQLWSTATPAALPTPTPRPAPVRASGRRGVATPTPAPVAAASPPARAAVPPPVQLTDNLDFDATSPIAWSAG